MTGERRRYSAAFKAKVALKGDLTVAALVAKPDAHQTLINTWKRQAVEGMSAVFWRKAAAAEHDHAEQRGDRQHQHAAGLVAPEAAQPASSTPRGCHANPSVPTPVRRGRG